MIKKLKNIKILKEFKMKYPKTLKLISKMEYYLRNNKFEQPIGNKQRQGFSRWIYKLHNSTNAK